jgi:hypothetical protein
LTLLHFSNPKIVMLLEVAAQSQYRLGEKTALNETLVASFISLLLLAVP